MTVAPLLSDSVTTATWARAEANANAGTGEQGLAAARATCDALAKQLGIAANQVLPFSTGVILEQLDRPKMALEAYELALAIYPHYDEANDAIARVRDLARGPEL